MLKLPVSFLLLRDRPMKTMPLQSMVFMISNRQCCGAQLHSLVLSSKQSLTHHVDWFGRDERFLGDDCMAKQRCRKQI